MTKLKEQNIPEKLSVARECNKIRNLKYQIRKYLKTSDNSTHNAIAFLRKHGWNLQKLKRSCQRIKIESEKLEKALDDIGMTQDERREIRSSYFQNRRKQRYEDKNFLWKAFEAEKRNSLQRRGTSSVTLGDFIMDSGSGWMRLYKEFLMERKSTSERPQYEKIDYGKKIWSTANLHVLKLCIDQGFTFKDGKMSEAAAYASSSKEN